jgi:hypothetical protein
MPVAARFSALVQTGRGAHPASYTLGTGSFPGVKRPGHGVEHPPQSSAEVKERVELYFSPFGPSWPVLGWNYKYHNFSKNLRSHLEILHVRSVAWSKLHTVDPQFCSDLWDSLLQNIRHHLTRFSRSDAEASEICAPQTSINSTDH